MAKNHNICSITLAKSELQIILEATAEIEHICNIIETTIYLIKLKKNQALQNLKPASIYQESSGKLFLANHMIRNEPVVLKSLENDHPKREKNPSKKLSNWFESNPIFSFLSF